MRIRAILVIGLLGSSTPGPLGAQLLRVRAGGEEIEGASFGAPNELVFRGIPYAAAPVGDLRWRPPVAHSPRKGVQSARDFGPVCVQSDRLTAWTKSIASVFGTADLVPEERRRTSEDCLYLNVWTVRSSGGNPKPVMVWIHGGSNLNGEGSSSWYDGAALARMGVVVVTINYRLGAFGFFAHSELTAESPHRFSGNYGLLDQLEALRWVRRNIAAFGGDPERITVFGESAGSIDILHLLASPLSRGLIHRAIAQSGAPMALVPRLAQAEARGAAAVQWLGSDGGSVPALRRAAPEEIQRLGDRMIAAGFLPGPVVDGWVLPDATGRIFDQGKQLPVPLLVGSNQREMTTLRHYLPQFPRTVAGYREWLAQTAGPAAARLAELYPVNDDGKVEPVLIDLVTDLYFTCPSRFAARTMARSKAPSYLYHFTRVIPGGEALGAYHAAEISYVFGNRLPWLPRTRTDDELSAAMAAYWTSFAATGRPEDPGRPTWPRYDPDTDRYLELGAGIEIKSGLGKAACDLMDAGFRAAWGPVP